MKRILILTTLAVALILSAWPRFTGGSTLLVSERIAAARCPDFILEVDEATTQLVDAVLKPDVQTSNGPGAEVIVLQDGKIRFLKGYGFANIDKRVRIDEKTVFNLASVSKQFTAIAIMKLVEQGILSLEDTLSSLLPKFKAVKGAGQIKVRHLLTHTSGMPNYLDAFGGNGEHLKAGSNPTNKDVITLLSRAKGLCFEPGTKWDYSNSGYVILAQIVEDKSKMRFADFMKKTFFDPLGMNSTFVRDERLRTMPIHATAYERAGAGFTDVTLSPLDSIYGDGNIYSTVCDVATWLHALLTIYLNDDQQFRKKVISQKRMKRVFSQVLLKNREKFAYGMGWMIFNTADLKKAANPRARFKDSDFKLDVVMHTGFWKGVRTLLGILPTRGNGTIGILLSNNGDFQPCAEANKVAKVYFSDVPGITNLFIDCPQSGAGVASRQDGHCDGMTLLSDGLKLMSSSTRRGSESDNGIVVASRQSHYRFRRAHRSSIGFRFGKLNLSPRHA